jgi:hypothetical protein
MMGYFVWVKAHPLVSAMLQFGVMGSLGELLAARLGSRKGALPFTAFQFLLKILAWAALGLLVKYGFTGMKGFTHALLDAHLLPSSLGAGLGWAFALSVLTNVFFGPAMMAFHRLEDNLILGQRGFKGIERAWWTLLYFWIPAHTVTFCLPAEFQIGLAALWGMVLGVILGLAKARA